MAQILVRDLNETIVGRLKKRAADNGRSLQGEVKAILEEAANVYSAEEALSIAMAWQEKLSDRTFDDSTDLVREDRER